MRRGRRKLRTLAAALLALALLVTSGPARAAGTVYFTAIGRNVQDLSDATMPFWSDGYLYVASTFFVGQSRELGVNYSYNAARQTVTLYSSTNRDTMRSLVFDMNQGYAVDNAGNLYFRNPIQRGSVIFLPISLVAQCCGLLYSTVEVPRGYLVWVRSESANMPERLFADAATSQMDFKYNQYLRAQEQTQTEIPNTPGQQEPPGPVSGHQVYLCLRAEPATAPGLLDALARRGSQGTFYCDLDFLETHGDLLRRMSATGQAIGLIADAGGALPVTEQLAAANAALCRATCTKSRLVWLDNATAQAAAAAAESGYLCLAPDLDRTDYPLNGSAAGGALARRIAGRTGDVSVWLAGGADGTGLEAFLRLAGEAGDRCIALTEIV